jgi:hypothetical protein
MAESAATAAATAAPGLEDSAVVEKYRTAAGIANGMETLLLFCSLCTIICTFQRSFVHFSTIGSFVYKSSLSLFSVQLKKKLRNISLSLSLSSLSLSLSFSLCPTERLTCRSITPFHKSRLRMKR